MNAFEHSVVFRVRYADTDQMGTYYNSRPLEWFETGRTELLRALGLPYSEIERRGILLPLVESHVEYKGKARYDDELRMNSRLAFSGRARLRFTVVIVQAVNGAPVAGGYTEHAVVNASGRPVRPPEWLRFPPPRGGGARGEVK